MHRFAVSAVLLLAVACGGPIPSPSPSALTTASPTALPTASPTAPPSTAPEGTVAPFILRELEGWTPVCGDVPFLDCYGVAALFANNLARNWLWVQEQSGGVVSVTPRPACPDFGDISGGMQDPSFCWQASATLADGQVCMVVARQTHPVMGFDFGQVGGDEMAGLAVPPGYTPPFPCI